MPPLFFKAAQKSMLTYGGHSNQHNDGFTNAVDGLAVHFLTVALYPSRCCPVTFMNYPPML